MITLLSKFPMGMTQEDSYNNLNIKLLVSDRHGRPRPYKVTDINSPSSPPGRDRNYASRFNGLNGRGLPKVPYRVTLSPLDPKQSDTIRGIKCFDSEIRDDFRPGGRGNELVVISSAVSCPSHGRLG